MPRPTPLGGFWALLLGGLFLAATVVYAHPTVDPSQCPNAHAAGNAGAFSDPAWDTRLPLLVLAWITLVMIEQTLPTSWRHREPAAAALRAALAVSVTIAAACFVVVPLETVCH